MRKRFLAMVALVLCLATLPLSPALGEASVYFLGTDASSPEYQMFVQAHPDVAVRTESNIFLSTTEIISALISNNFPYDTFVMTSASFDVKKLMQKGYCAELSDSSLAGREIAAMYESVRRQLSFNGKTFGVPFYCYVGYYAYQPDAWAEAGLSEKVVPTTFTAYLDFLEAWVTRIKDAPEDAISVCNAFDSEQYGPQSYIFFLVDKLIRNHIMQSNYAREPIRFDTPVFGGLLARCQKIGADLYTYEPKQKGESALFDDRYGMRELSHLVPLRLTQAQPVLITATLHMAFVNAKTHQPELAAEFLQDYMTCTAPEDAAYLYPDAQPVEDPDFKRLMDAQQETVDGLVKQVAALGAKADLIKHSTLHQELTSAKCTLEEMSVSEKRYLISPKDLELYRVYGPALYFQPPSIFDPSTPDGQNLKQQISLFSAGSITAKQLINRLGELANMLELEAE